MVLRRSELSGHKEDTLEGFGVGTFEHVGLLQGKLSSWAGTLKCRMGPRGSSSEHQGGGLICANLPEWLVKSLVNITCVGLGMSREPEGWVDRKQLQARLEFT